MARRVRKLKRPTILPDKTFNSELVSRLINRVMWSGKKTTANKIVIEALNSASATLQVEPVEVLEKAIDNVKPEIEVKGVRVGGANYQVPIEPYPARQLRLGLTWITDAARAIKGRPMAEKLSEILVQSYNNEGPAIEKRDQTHAMAAANKAFAHLAMRSKKKK